MLRDVISFFFPRICLLCDRALIPEEHHLCTHCIAGLPVNRDHSPENRAARIISHLYGLRGAYFLFNFEKNGPVQTLMHDIKYRGNRDLALRLGRLFGKQIATVLPDINIVLPLPLYPGRLKKRGFNQSALISAGLSDYIGAPVRDDILLRKLDTLSQTSKTRVERIENMTDAFEVSAPECIRGQDILLIDDVITTGATAESAAMEVFKYKPSSLTLAFLAAAL